MMLRLVSYLHHSRYDRPPPLLPAREAKLEINNEKGSHIAGGCRITDVFQVIVLSDKFGKFINLVIKY